MNFIPKKDAIKLSQEMVIRYTNKLNNISNEPECPICVYFGQSGIYTNCKKCFNYPYDYVFDVARCMNFKTMDTVLSRENHNAYRLLFWNEVVKYLLTIDNENISIDTLRDKCTKIDNMLI